MKNTSGFLDPIYYSDAYLNQEDYNGYFESEDFGELFLLEREQKKERLSVRKGKKHNSNKGKGALRKK